MSQNLKPNLRKTQNYPQKTLNHLPSSSKLQKMKTSPITQATDKNHQQKIVLENSETSKSISSKQSAFWPFTKSFEQNNFLSHIITQDQEPLPEKGIQKTQCLNFIEDPTQKLFTRLKKCQGDVSYSMDEIVLAKCVGEPLWPARITSIENVEGFLPDGKVYNLKFINESNTCMIDKASLIKFNESSMEELRNIVENKKLLRAIKLAQKYFKQQLQDSQSQPPNQKVQNMNEPNKTEIQLSLSSLEPCNSSQNVCEKVVQNIQKCDDGFLILKKTVASKNRQENAEPVDQIQENSGQMTDQSSVPDFTKSNLIEQIKTKKVNIFKPIILLKGETMQINFHDGDFKKDPLKSDHDDRKNYLRNFNHQQDAKVCDEVSLQKDRNKETTERPIDNEQSKEGKIKISKSLAKPINLVLQTPKLNPSEYYLNKIIVRFNQEQKSVEEEELKPSKLLDIDLDETIMEQSNPNPRILCEQSPFKVKITQKVQTLKQHKNSLTSTKKTGKKYVQKLNSYLHQFIQELTGINQITQKKKKEDEILQFLSTPLSKLLSRCNYLEYDRLLKNSVQLIQKSLSFKSDGLFIMNLQHKLQSIWEFLSVYAGDNNFITRVKNNNALIFNKFFKSEQKQKFSSVPTSKNSSQERNSKIEVSKSKQLAKQKNGNKTSQGVDGKISKGQDEVERDEFKRGAFKVKLKRMMIQSDEAQEEEEETSPCIQTN